MGVEAPVEWFVSDISWSSSSSGSMGSSTIAAGGGAGTTGRAGCDIEPCLTAVLSALRSVIQRSRYRRYSMLALSGVSRLLQL